MHQLFCSYSEETDWDTIREMALVRLQKSIIIIIINCPS